MSIVAQLLIALISSAPQAIPEITNLYNAVKGSLSSNDQAAIDTALAAAQASDAAATAAADAALAAAAQRT